MMETIAAAQRAIGTSDEPARVSREFLRAAPVPASRLEELVLFGLTFETAAGGFGVSLASSRRRARRILRTLERKNRAHARDRFEKARQAATYLLDHATERFDVRAVAAHCAMDQTGLRRLFKEAYGLSMREYHTVLRVCRAARLFAEGTEDVSAVARLVGYRSEKNFYRAVREVTGLTPAQLRAERIDCAWPTCACLPGRGCFPALTSCPAPGRDRQSNPRPLRGRTRTASSRA
jgi:AraC-like DNA-binding protein